MPPGTVDGQHRILAPVGCDEPRSGVEIVSRAETWQRLALPCNAQEASGASSNGVIS